MVGLRKQMSSSREGILVVIVVFGVDLGLSPSEDPERVVGPEVGEREGNGPGPGLPRRGGGKERVTDEMVVMGVRGRVDSNPVKVGGGVDSGPGDGDVITGFGENGRSH